MNLRNGEGIEIDKAKMNTCVGKCWEAKVIVMDDNAKSRMIREGRTKFIMQYEEYN